jgi:hypothetical protein
VPAWFFLFFIGQSAQLVGPFAVEEECQRARVVAEVQWAARPGWEAGGGHPGLCWLRERP